MLRTERYFSRYRRRSHAGKLRPELESWPTNLKAPGTLDRSRRGYPPHPPEHPERAVRLLSGPSQSKAGMLAGLSLQ